MMTMVVVIRLQEFMQHTSVSLKCISLSRKGCKEFCTKSQGSAPATRNTEPYFLDICCVTAPYLVESAMKKSRAMFGLLTK